MIQDQSESNSERGKDNKFYLSEEVGLGMGIVKVLTVLLLLSIRYFNSILIGTFCYLYIYIHTYTYMYEIYISMID